MSDAYEVHRLVRSQVAQPAKSLSSDVSYGSQLRRGRPDISVGYERGLAATAAERLETGTFNAQTARMSQRPIFKPSVVQHGCRLSGPDQGVEK